MINKDIFWIWTTLFSKVNAEILSNLIVKCGSIDELWNMKYNDLKEFGLFNDSIIKSITDNVNKEKAIEIFEYCNDKNINYIFFKDEKYPSLLRNIDTPPRVLYYIGNIDLCKNAIAIVGSRKCSYYGENCAYNMAVDLAKNNYTVVSGLALGIDTFAHAGALKVNGNTIAILGNGVDIIYPRENIRLYEEIAIKGAIVSEYPPKTPPLRYNFPLRNRIISGVSVGTVVVEAGTKSGSLITAGYAGTQGREVFAVPGDVSKPYAKGTNALIRDGATLVTNAQEVIEGINGFCGCQYCNVDNRNNYETKFEKLTLLQREICNIILYKESNVEELISKMNIDFKKLNLELTLLEMQNIIGKRKDERYYLC